METSGQAPRGAGLEPITVAAARREPTTRSGADSRVCAEGLSLRSWFLESNWLSENGAASLCLKPASWQGWATWPLCQPLPGRSILRANRAPSSSLLGAQAGEGWRPEQQAPMLGKSAEPDTNHVHKP